MEARIIRGEVSQSHDDKMVVKLKLNISEKVSGGMHFVVRSRTLITEFRH